MTEINQLETSRWGKDGEGKTVLISICVACGTEQEVFVLQHGSDENILEELASLEHDQWVHWMRYLIQTAFVNVDTEYVELKILKPIWERWTRQMETKYAHLSENEKKSDKEWASHALQIIVENSLEEP